MGKFRNVLAVAVFAGSVVSVGATAAERHKISGIQIGLGYASKTEAVIGDAPNHTVVFGAMNWIGKSPDPDFDGAVVTSHFYQDTVSTGGTMLGYNTQVHKTGERTFYSVEGSIRYAPKEGGGVEFLFEGRWKATGGTGKFRGIKGDGTVKGRGSAQGMTMEWAGDVEY